MKKIAILTLAGLISVSANAENWKQIAASATNDIYYLDLDSIHTTKAGYVQAYSIIKYSPQNSHNYFYNFGADTMWALLEYDCKSRPVKSRVLAYRYLRNNQVFYTNNTPEPFAYVFPGSVGQTFIKYTCK